MEFQLQDDNDSKGSTCDTVSPQQRSVEDRKIFVGEISRETTQEDLKDYFMQFGEVKEVLAFTSSPKAFAFVTFDRSDSVVSVLNSNPHHIKGKQIEIQKAFVDRNANKIFVGGIGDEMTEGEIFNYFGNFGKVEKVEFTFDSFNRRKRFCFVTFEDGAIVNQVCRRPVQRIGNQLCRVKRATSKHKRVPRNRNRSSTQQRPWEGASTSKD